MISLLNELTVPKQNRKIYLFICVSPVKCLCVFMSVLCVVAMSVSRPERYESFGVFLCVSCEVSMSVSRREMGLTHDLTNTYGGEIFAVY